MSSFTHYLIVKNNTAVGVIAKDEADALAQGKAMGIERSIVRVDASLNTAAAKIAKADGYRVVETGGSCTAYRKDFGNRYVLITGEDGTDHRLADLSDSYLVGAYDTTTGDELGLLIGDAASLSTIEQAIAAAEKLGKAGEVLVWDTKLAIKVAKAFGEQLQMALTAKEMSKVIYRNKVENSESVCHSHDFCDANMVMLSAIVSVLGWSEDDFDVSNQTHCDLWNAAWDIAKAADFFI